MRYLEGEEITPDEVNKAIGAAIRAGSLHPVFVTSAEKGVGVKVGGNAHRNQPAFALFFDDLTKDLNDTLSS